MIDSNLESITQSQEAPNRALSGLEGLDEGGIKQLSECILTDYLQPGLENSGSLVDRWNRQEEHILNTAQVNRKTGRARLFVPFTSVICRMVAGRMVYALTANETKVICKMRGPNAVHGIRKIQDTLHFFLEKNGMYKIALLDAITRTTWQHKCIGKVSYRRFAEEPRIDCDILDSRNVAVYDGLRSPIGDKKLLMERVTPTYYDLKFAEKQGLFNEVDNIVAGNPPEYFRQSEDLRNWKKSTVGQGTILDSQFVPVWHGIVMWSTEKYGPPLPYSVAITENNRKLIRFVRYKPKRTPFIEGSFYAVDKVFWPEVGLATDLQALQEEINAVTNVGLDGFAIASMNAFNQEMTGGVSGQAAQQLMDIPIGGIVPPGLKLTPVMVTNQHQFAHAWIDQLWRRGMLVAAINEMNFGGAVPGIETLGEAKMSQAEVSVQFDQRTAYFASTFCTGLFQTMVSLLYENWDDWFPVYGEMLELADEDRDLFNQPMVLIPASDSFRSTPIGRRSELMQIAELFMGTPLRVFIKNSGYALAAQIMETVDMPQKDSVLINEQEVREMLVKMAKNAKEAQNARPEGQPFSNENGSGTPPSEPAEQPAV